ncbi:hypothetical protein GF326_06175 [Candidatus Bathyarchaeota archaeon]|nr:hypothetical protein [Candidatus Bathyarchaeota archaeon]
MEQIKLLDEITSKTAPGRTPDFTRAHVLYALILLKDKRIGRKQLSDELRLGEGTIRTMLGRFQEHGLIKVNRSGATLCEYGRAFMRTLEKVLTWKPLPESEITVDMVNWVVLIRGASEKVRLGVKQRDQALIHGATGATTLIYRGGEWIIPGVEEDIRDVVLDGLSDLDPRDNDVAIIGSSDDGFTAALGSLAASIDLLA